MAVRKTFNSTSCIQIWSEIHLKIFVASEPSTCLLFVNFESSILYLHHFYPPLSLPANQLSFKFMASWLLSMCVCVCVSYFIHLVLLKCMCVYLGSLIPYLPSSIGWALWDFMNPPRYVNWCYHAGLLYATILFDFLSWFCILLFCWNFDYFWKASVGFLGQLMHNILLSASQDNLTSSLLFVFFNFLLLLLKYVRLWLSVPPPSWGMPSSRPAVWVTNFMH